MKQSLLIPILLCLLLSGMALALPRPVGKNKTHVMGEKDTIFTVSRQYGLAPDHVLWANEMTLTNPPQKGDELIIPLRRIPPFTPRESTAIVLNLPERMLYLFRNGRMTKFWGVAIGGVQYPTPSGTFRIIDKEKNPTWEPPAWLERKTVGPGPDNPLGDRWMQITPGMVGIHGTNNPDSIGGFASLGCVRLYPEAIRELYDQVSVGTPVYAIYEQVRVGQEEDGTLVWSAFPDPYTKYYARSQARDGLAQASAEGNRVDISDFEIKERLHSPNGLITPLFGTPIKVVSDRALEEPTALKKPTGLWLNAKVLENYGVSVSQEKKTTVLTSSTGQTAKVTAQKLPLNPHRLPPLAKAEELLLEGHRWRDSTWVPFPLILDYFAIPYSWDKTKSVLDLRPKDAGEPG